MTYQEIIFLVVGVLSFIFGCVFASLICLNFAGKHGGKIAVKTMKEIEERITDAAIGSICMHLIEKAEAQSDTFSLTLGEVMRSTGVNVDVVKKDLKDFKDFITNGKAKRD